jgi:hypothetical protein
MSKLILDRYQILQKLEEHSDVKLYVAKDTATKNRVLLKRYFSERSTEPQLKGLSGHCISEVSIQKLLAKKKCEYLQKMLTVERMSTGDVVVVYEYLEEGYLLANALRVEKN